MSRKSKLNKQIQEEAAEWFVEMDRDEVDLASRQRFDEWLRRSPEHVQAFLELVPIWEQAGARRRESGEDPESIIARALSAHDNVLPLQTGREPPVRVSAEQRVRSRAWVAIAASLLLAVIGGSLHLQRGYYSTGIGEHRSFVLADGSVIELNARTRVRVRYSEHGRDIDLLEGQALFQVAHDETRPFVVHSGDALVRAVGTQFDVYRKRTGTVVTVVEGRVSVLAQAHAPLPIPISAPQDMATDQPRQSPGQLLLAAGQQVVVSSSTIEPAQEANVAAATAWTQRRLVFRKTTLAEVADEFSRYNEKPLRIVDPEIQSFLISGTFSSTDPASLIRFLREQPGMRVVETSGAVLIEAAP